MTTLQQQIISPFKTSKAGLQARWSTPRACSLAAVSPSVSTLPDLTYEFADNKLISAAAEGLTYTWWVLHADQETATGRDEVVFPSHGVDDDDADSGSGSGERPVDQPCESVGPPGLARRRTQGRACALLALSRKARLAIEL